MNQPFLFSFSDSLWWSQSNALLGMRFVGLMSEHTGERFMEVFVAGKVLMDRSLTYGV